MRREARSKRSSQLSCRAHTVRVHTPRDGRESHRIGEKALGAWEGRGFRDGAQYEWPGGGMRTADPCASLI
jgi:hypothetical protein